MNLVSVKPPFELGSVQRTVTEVVLDDSHFKNLICEGVVPAKIVRLLLSLLSPISFTARTVTVYSCPIIKPDNITLFVSALLRVSYTKAGGLPDLSSR